MKKWNQENAFSEKSFISTIQNICIVYGKTKSLEENMVVIKDTKIFCFNVDWPKYVDESFKYKIEFIMKSNEYLQVNKKTRNWTIIVKI